MISSKKYVILSLELHLFFARIMKEHSLFLEAGFTPKNSKLAKEANGYKEQFEKILLDAVKLSGGRIRESVIESGEIFTEYRKKDAILYWNRHKHKDNRNGEKTRLYK